MGTYPFTINGQQYSFTMSLTSGAIDVNAAVRVQFNSDARDAICNLIWASTKSAGSDRFFEFAELAGRCDTNRGCCVRRHSRSTKYQ
jgi:hypothetical protein